MLYLHKKYFPCHRLFHPIHLFPFPTDAYIIIFPPPFYLVLSSSITSCLDLPRISYPVYMYGGVKPGLLYPPLPFGLGLFLFSVEHLGT